MGILLKMIGLAWISYSLTNNKNMEYSYTDTGLFAIRARHTLLSFTATWGQRHACFGMHSMTKEVANADGK